MTYKKYALFLFVISAFISTQLAYAQNHQDPEYRNYAPVISPDGASVAFYAKIDGNWDVYIIDVDGKNRRRLTTHTGYDGEPSWSPDSKQIAFTSDRDGDDEIFILDLKSLNLEQITFNLISDNYPVFSEKGDRIIYRNKVGSQWFPFTVSLKDKQSRVLTNIPIEGRIRRSTEGKSLCFVTNYQDRFGICRIDSDGNLLSITFTKFDFIGNPHYSDSNSTFLFDAHQDGSGSSGDGKWELWTINSNGGGLQQVTQNSHDDWGASWSKDNKSIAFAGGGMSNTGYEIFYLDLKQQETKQLTFQRK